MMTDSDDDEYFKYESTSQKVNVPTVVEFSTFE